jgi:hypothetical protein
MYTDDPYDGDIYSISRAMSGSHGGVTAIGSNKYITFHVSVKGTGIDENTKMVPNTVSLPCALPDDGHLYGHHRLFSPITPSSPVVTSLKHFFLAHLRTMLVHAYRNAHSGAAASASAQVKSSMFFDINSLALPELTQSKLYFQGTPTRPWVGVPREVFPNERRVALSKPQNVTLLRKKGFAEVVVERNTGTHAQFLNDDYEKAGACLLVRRVINCLPRPTSYSRTDLPCATRRSTTSSTGALSFPSYIRSK